jgi:hypothetical protein
MRRTWPRTRQLRTWPPIQASRFSTHRMPLRAINRPLHRRTRAMPQTRLQTNLRMIRATGSSPTPTPLSRLLPCPTTTSLRTLATTTSGHPAIGPLLQWVITGCRGRGLRLPTRALSGPLATGASGITATAFTAATGAGTSATMAASTTASATSASGTRAVIGVVATSTTTAR